MFQLRGIFRAWRWLLVLGPVLVIAIAFQSLWALRVAGEHRNPDEMSVETERLARLVDAYLKRVVGVTAFLTVSPEVLTMAEGAPLGASKEADEQAEKNWTALANSDGDPFKKYIAGSALSNYFAELKAAGGSAYREIFLCDRQGRVIAASNRTEDYLQGDDPWWPKYLEPKVLEGPTDKEEKARENASGVEAERIRKNLIRCRHLPMECAHIGGVEWDSSAGLFGYDVVLPVVNAEGQAVGVLKAVVDPKELEGLLDFAASKQAIDMALLDANGKRVFSRDPFFDKSFVPRLGSLALGAEGSWPLGESGSKSPMAFVRRLSSQVEGGWFIALADRGGKEDDGWGPYVLWCLFTLGMFVVAAGAFAVRGLATVDSSQRGEVA